MSNKEWDSLNRGGNLALKLDAGLDGEKRSITDIHPVIGPVIVVAFSFKEESVERVASGYGNFEIGDNPQLNTDFHPFFIPEEAVIFVFSRGPVILFILPAERGKYTDQLAKTVLTPGIDTMDGKVESSNIQSG